MIFANIKLKSKIFKKSIFKTDSDESWKIAVIEFLAPVQSIFKSTPSIINLSAFCESTNIRIQFSLERSTLEEYIEFLKRYNLIKKNCYALKFAKCDWYCKKFNFYR